MKWITRKEPGRRTKDPPTQTLIVEALSKLPVGRAFGSDKIAAEAAAMLIAAAPTMWAVLGVLTHDTTIRAWLEENAPDVLCIQETKVVDDAFPREGFEALGYELSIFGQRTYNGVAIASKLPIEDTETGLPLADDEEARGIAATIGGVRIVGIYVPNGREAGTDKYEYKLRWLDALRAWLDDRYDLAQPLVVAGDFNMTPYSTRYGNLRRDSGLRRASGGLNTTWPALMTPLGLALDHFLVGAKVRRAAMRVGPRLWSDYRPIIGTFELGP